MRSGQCAVPLCLSNWRQRGSSGCQGRRGREALIVMQCLNPLSSLSSALTPCPTCPAAVCCPRHAITVPCHHSPLPLSVRLSNDVLYITTPAGLGGRVDGQLSGWGGGGGGRMGEGKRADTDVDTRERQSEYNYYSWLWYFNVL